MSSRRWLLRSVGVAALALSALLRGPDPAGAQGAGGGSGPGCHPTQVAQAHHAGGAAVSPPPAGAPVPCGMATGYAGGESAIAVTNDGAVFYSPAVQSFAGVATQYFLGGNSGFARTTDLGKTWSFVNPISPNVLLPTNLAGRPGYPAWDQIDDKFYVDRDTGRLFWADPDLPSEVVLWTNDDGLSWGYSDLPVGFGGEWTQVTTAKPRTSKPTGYPKVVYACGEYDTIGRNGDLCQKSLDGGQTWVFAGQGLFGTPANHTPQCGGQSEHPNFSPWAAPDSQGRLFELLFCGGKTFLIRSDDEGAAWQVAAQIPYNVPADGPNGEGSAELRTDSQDNMYLAWTIPGNPNPNSGYMPSQLYLGVSRDYGNTWGPAMEVLAPGVTGIRTHFGFDVGVPGNVAFSYLGHTNNSRPGFDGYITETFDALAAKPLFWSAMANDPTQTPLDLGGKGSSNGLGLDYVSALIGPDGTPWASFWDACGEDLPQPSGCPAGRKTPGTTTYGFTDFAGRLANTTTTPTAPAGASPSPTTPPACAPPGRIRFRLHPGPRARVVRAEVFVNGTLVLDRRGHSLRQVTIARPSGARFTVRIVNTRSTGATVTTTRTYRLCYRKTRPRQKVHHRARRRGRGRGGSRG